MHRLNTIWAFKYDARVDDKVLRQAVKKSGFYCPQYIRALDAFDAYMHD